MRALPSVLAACLLGALVPSCGSSMAPLPPRASLIEPSDEASGFRSPARWRYHPKKEAALLARFEIEKGRELYAGERGERWLIDKKKKRVDAAARLAPEQLISILKTKDGGWLFVGASGTGYEAREPLGPFVRSSAPLDRLAHVSAAGSTIVGVTKSGVLTRTRDAGGSWQAIGPKDLRFVDVALTENGHGLAVAVPERLFRSDDSGATWKPLDLPSTGAYGLLDDGKNEIVVTTALGNFSYKPEGPTPLVKSTRPPQKSRFRLKLPPPRGPDAGAMTSGRAVVLGREYIEVSEAESGSSKWQIWRGRVDGPLIAKPFDRAKGCKSVWLAGFDRWLYLACMGPLGGSTQSLEVFRSDNRGKSWKREDYEVEAKSSELDLAVGAGGALIMTGVCTSTARGRGCSPYGVHYRRLAKDDDKKDKHKKGKQKREAAEKKKADEQKKKKDDKPRYELALAPAPSLKGSADEIAFSPDGRVAFAVGKRTKNNAFAIFVSTDGGQSFAAREIDQIPPGSETETTEDHYYYGRRPQNVGGKVLSARASDDGTLGMVFERDGKPVAVVADEEGRILSIAAPPPEATTIGMAGSRGIALSPGTQQVWETLDGGATWDSIGRLPIDLCPGNAQCQTAVACHAGGCVVGHELSRIGWRGQADDDRGVLASADERTPDLFDRRVRTPIACSLEEGSWSALEGVTQAPTADQAAIGKYAWFAAVQDEERAAASILKATGGARPTVENVQLLSPSARAADQAIYVSTQVEGVAALRYPTPESSGAGQLRNIEIAWDNLMEGKLVRTRLPDGGPYRPGDYARGSGRAQLAKPALFSIGEGGIYLRPHYSERDDQVTYFLDGHSVATVPAVQWPATARQGRSEMARIDGTHVPLLLIDGGGAIVRARRAGTSWSFDAFATGLASPREFDLSQSWDIAYTAGRAAMHLLIYDPQGLAHESVLYPFRSSGAVVDAAVPAPTQRDAGDNPKRCGSATKTSTPRVVTPAQGGTRHPIIVTDTSEPMRALLSDSAVMYGTPDEPCIAALDAEVVPIDLGAAYGAGAGGMLGYAASAPPETEREQAVILLDDMEHAWLFRHVSQPNGKTRVEYRVMSCRFDPSVDVPPEVYEQQGTLVRRTR